MLKMQEVIARNQYPYSMGRYVFVCKGLYFECETPFQAKLFLLKYHCYKAICTALTLWP
jgi:hypothetical protein